MKSLVVLLFSLAVSFLRAQTLPTNDQIFEALNGNHYDPVTKVATWKCPQAGESAPDGCRLIGDSTAEVDLLQVMLIKDAGIWKAFVAASAVGRLEGCHACAPLVAVGVLAFRDNQWLLESRNDEKFRFGEWGQPGDLKLVKAGPHLYGFMFSQYDGNGGYFGTSVDLLLPEGKNIPEVWRGVLDEDNQGAYDPTDKYASHERIHVDAAYRFLQNGDADHYILQVISRGHGYGDGEKYVSRNGVFTYRFFNGQYQKIVQQPRNSKKTKKQQTIKAVK